MIPRLHEVFIITIFDYPANSEYISLDLDIRISPLLMISMNVECTHSKYLHTYPFLQSDDKKKQGESSKKEIKKFRELSFHAQSSEEDGGVEVVEPAPRPSTVSCDWWRRVT